MTILITGGTGKTGLALSRLLEKANHPVLIASRKGAAPAPFKAVTFDWFNPATFENPFQVDANIDRVYLVGPPVVDALTHVKPFIDLAISKGVKRFVLLSATISEPGSFGTGFIHQYLLDIGVDYAVLRPTWFIQNFGVNFVHSITHEDHVFSAAKDGRIPFISTEDIAQAAFDALTAAKSPNQDYFIVGPELLSYDDVAKLLTEVLGRKIAHRRISVDEAIQIYTTFGMSHDYAKGLATSESLVAEGTEEKAFNANKDRKIVGKHTLRGYVEAHREIWAKV
ncbi:hypothetical protein B0H34DRAFT_712102 [Crassisporium funariophilum]|nr:hypothetical protein B0H34DRAFT_712102 [Crassisporium funariophilum]